MADDDFCPGCGRKIKAGETVTCFQGALYHPMCSPEGESHG